MTELDEIVKDSANPEMVEFTKLVDALIEHYDSIEDLNDFRSRVREIFLFGEKIGKLNNDQEMQADLVDAEKQVNERLEKYFVSKLLPKESSFVRLIFGGVSNYAYLLFQIIKTKDGASLLIGNQEKNKIKKKLNKKDDEIEGYKEEKAYQESVLRKQERKAKLGSEDITDQSNKLIQDEKKKTSIKRGIELQTLKGKQRISEVENIVQQILEDKNYLENNKDKYSQICDSIDLINIKEINSLLICALKRDDLMLFEFLSKKIDYKIASVKTIFYNILEGIVRKKGLSERQGEYIVWAEKFIEEHPILMREAFEDKFNSFVNRFVGKKLTSDEKKILKNFFNCFRYGYLDKLNKPIYHANDVYNTLIYTAAEKNSIWILKQLFEFGTNVDLSPRYCTPLEIALILGHDKLASFLISKGAAGDRIWAKTIYFYRNNKLDDCIMHMEDNKFSAKNEARLIPAAPGRSRRRSLLSLAIRDKKMPIVTFLCELGVDIQLSILTSIMRYMLSPKQVLDEFSSENKQTNLLYGTNLKKYEFYVISFKLLLKSYLKNGSIEALLQFKQRGLNLLELAKDFNLSEVWQILLLRGFTPMNVDEITPKAFQLLSKNTIQDNEKLNVYFKKNYKKINFNSKNKNGRILLEEAISLSNDTAFKLIYHINTYEINFSLLNEACIHFEDSNSNAEFLWDFLLEELEEAKSPSAIINHTLPKDPNKNLFIKILSQRLLKTAKRFIDLGADLEKYDPLSYCLDNIKIFTLLQEKGAIIKFEHLVKAISKISAHCATKLDLYEVIDLLLIELKRATDFVKKLNAVHTDLGGKTILHYCLLFAEEALIKKLLFSGADCNSEDPKENSAKHYAIQNDSASIYRLFKQFPTRKNNHDLTEINTNSDSNKLGQ